MTLVDLNVWHEDDVGTELGRGVATVAFPTPA